MATKYAKQTFIIVPNRNTLQEVSGLAQAVYLWLCAMQDTSGQAFPSHNRLASLTNQSVRSVIRKLAELEAAGLITKSLQFGDKGQASNLYDVMIIDVEPVMEPEELAIQETDVPSDSQSPPQCHTVTPPVTHSHGGGDSQSHRTISKRTIPKELKGTNVPTSQRPEPSRHGGKTYRQIFHELTTALGHTAQTRPLDGRIRKLSLRLKQYSVEELLTAARNMAADPWYSGDNPKGKRYAHIDKLLESDEVVDRWANADSDNTEAALLTDFTKEYA